jgi:ferric-dicitrate binding protein FerR (iron transport regulator)
MTRINDGDFEPVVREAMHARPQPRPISNLAYRAMELAREQARALARQQLEGLTRLRRRTRRVGISAAVLIALVVWAGAMKLSNSWTSSTASTTASADGNSDSTSTTSSDTTTPGAALTAEMIVVALILLSAGVAWSCPEGDLI